MAKGKYEHWLTEDGLAKLQGWARAGLVDTQIAHNCGINRDTLKQWKKRYPAISATLKEGKEVVDFQVENALLKRALGYMVEEKTHEHGMEPDGQAILILTKVVTKEVPPDVTACIYWLKNRKRDMWKDNHDRAEVERERVELEKLRVESEISSKNAGPQVIEVVWGDNTEDYAK